MKASLRRDSSASSTRFVSPSGTRLETNHFTNEWAFAEWLQNRSKPESTPVDKTAELITTTLYELVEQKRLKFRHGGYLVRRGRGRVIVEPAKSE